MSRGSSSYRLISAASTRSQQQTHRPLPLQSIDGTDEPTDTRRFYDAYHIICGSLKNKELFKQNNITVNEFKVVYQPIESTIGIILQHRVEVFECFDFGRSFCV